MSLDNYLSGYLDRRMSQIISEWQLATRDEMGDLTRRFSRVQDDLTNMKTFEKETGEKLSNLEERVKNIRRNRNDTS